jgi:hypothetical protein
MKTRPGLRTTRDIHHSTHIPDDLRRHGPVNNHCTSGGEHVGKEYKIYNANAAGLMQHRLFRSAQAPEEIEAVLNVGANGVDRFTTYSQSSSNPSLLFDTMMADLEHLSLGVNRPSNPTETVLLQGQKAVYCHFPMKQGAIMRDWLDNSPEYGPDRTYSVEHGPESTSPTMFIVCERDGKWTI